jgi:hypothetical protein
MEIRDILDSMNWIDRYAAAIWFFLSLILIGILLQLYLRAGTQSSSFWMGIGLLLLIWLYPLYTAWFKLFEIGTVGNIITLGYTLVYRSRIQKINPKWGRWLWPHIIWMGLATLFLGLQIWQKYS